MSEPKIPKMYAGLPESSERLIDFGLRDWRKVSEV